MRLAVCLANPVASRLGAIANDPSTYSQTGRERNLRSSIILSTARALPRHRTNTQHPVSAIKSQNSGAVGRNSTTQTTCLSSLATAGVVEAISQGHPYETATGSIITISVGIPGRTDLVQDAWGARFNM